LWQEYGLCSDAAFQGQLELGPTSVCLAFPPDEPRVGQAQLQLVLRVRTHLGDAEYDAGSAETEDVSDYHGGDIDDEFAALLSLAVGRRLRSGGVTRHHFGGRDPAGEPFMGWHRERRLAAPAGGRSMLPRLADVADLRDAQALMATYSVIGGSDATALVRAASQFADGLWWADLDPRIAWIKLVGALEIAAAQWDASQESTPRERFKRYRGPLYGRLKKLGPEVVDAVIGDLGEHTGSQERFLQFTIPHAPLPPQVRPEFGAVDWKSLRGVLNVIYDWRSRDLHAGVPFPGPMCDPPQSDSGGVLCECFPALAAQQAGGSWPAARMPMYLHTFAYVVRQALTSWWIALPDAGLVAALADGDSDSPPKA
jgi:hypothetical protein